MEIPIEWKEAVSNEVIKTLEGRDEEYLIKFMGGVDEIFNWDGDLLEENEKGLMKIYEKDKDAEKAAYYLLNLVSKIMKENE